MNVKSRKAEQSGQTRAALLAAARKLFTDRGFADTPTEEIVQRAGVTRGALYHHFRDKEDLFRAVHEEVERDLVQKIGVVVLSQQDPWKRLEAGSQAFLDACLEPAVHRIALLEAPTVLGWEAWREIESRYGLGLIQQGLEAAMDAGVIETQAVPPLAHMLLGALTEAGLLLARSPDPGAARAEIGATVERLLNGLRYRAS